MADFDDLGAAWDAAMRAGDFRRAWTAADAVLAARDPATRDDARLPYHRRWVWDGRAFDGRAVLVRCYHGLGDTLQFARFLPLLRARAASLTVEVPAALLPLLATVPGPDRLVAFDVAAPAPPMACDIEIMELSHALRCPPDAVPPPYLHVVPATSLPDAVGLCWRAGDWDALRSISPTLLAGLFDAAVSLVPGPAPEVLAVCNPEGAPQRIEATAALIAALDGVVTVDSMVAHLAGALGRPTWLLLRHEADWRWGEGDRSPWYPSMRLLRQPAAGDWGSVVARLGSGGLTAG